jgi:bifunctional UDP-N-acetylglucosamine pyrophosphorylase/glucosamine-1-phosphate N-acetyltransferase
MLVAPVIIGDGAYTAAGSVITNDVPPGAIGVGRAQQRNVEGWVERKRPNSRSAAAARRARERDIDGQGATGQATMEPTSPVEGNQPSDEQGAGE